MAFRTDIPRYKLGQNIEEYLKMFDMVADLNKLTTEQKKGHLLLVFDFGTLPHKLISDSPASEDFVA